MITFKEWTPVLLEVLESKLCGLQTQEELTPWSRACDVQGWLAIPSYQVTVLRQFHLLQETSIFILKVLKSELQWLNETHPHDQEQSLT